MLPNGQSDASELVQEPPPTEPVAQATPLVEPTTQLNIVTPIEETLTSTDEPQKTRARSATPRKRAKRLPKGAIDD